MGYLNKATITVDAILTNRGRELLAKGGTGEGGFQISQFAVADDEVDYSLYFSNHPLGDLYAGNVIENMPLMEATPDESQIMRYKLVTFTASDTQFLSADGAFVLPQIANFGETSGTTSLQASPNSTNNSREYTPSTTGNVNTTTFSEDYTLLVANARIMRIFVRLSTGTETETTARNADGSVTVNIPRGASVRFTNNGTQVGTSTATIFGQSTGATKTITIAFTRV